MIEASHALVMNRVRPRLMHKRNAISKNEREREGSRGVSGWTSGGVPTLGWRHKYGSCLPKQKVCETHETYEEVQSDIGTLLHSVF